MVVTDCQNANAHSPEIEHVLLIEGDVSLPELGALQQFGVERREPAEPFGRLEPRVRDLLNLPHGGRLQRFTSATITSRVALADELARTRERGYSECRGEFDESAWGVSAPVRDVADRPVAVLSIWGPPERITAKRFDSLGAMAVAGAEEIAGRS